MSTYTYMQTQTPADPCGELWTTGRHINGRWIAESDWGTEEEARERVESLNAASTLNAALANPGSLTLILAMATFERENPLSPLPPEPRAPEEWPAGSSLGDPLGDPIAAFAGDPAIEFPRTIEQIRRESPEEYRELGLRRAAEFQADFAAVAARLPKA